MQFKLFLISTLTLWCIVSPGSAQSQQSDIYLDHITIAVSDLNKAAKAYSDLGFTIKDGTLHSNGLLNKHLKFRDKTSLELMTVQGEPKDELAEIYHNFLKEQEGGIYLALRASFDIVLEKADELGLGYQVHFGDPFSYITFEHENLKNVFFINYSTPFSDPDSITTHKNKVYGIKSVWVQSTPLFTQLLTSLGAEFKGVLNTPDEKENVIYRLNGYDFIIDESMTSNPKIAGVLFDTNQVTALEWLPPSKNHGIWISFQ